jgi:hypothetical protein
MERVVNHARASFNSINVNHTYEAKNSDGAVCIDACLCLGTKLGFTQLHEG